MLSRVSCNFSLEYCKLFEENFQRYLVASKHFLFYLPGRLTLDLKDTARLLELLLYLFAVNCGKN